MKVSELLFLVYCIGWLLYRVESQERKRLGQLVNQRARAQACWDSVTVGCRDGHS